MVNRLNRRLISTPVELFACRCQTVAFYFKNSSFCPSNQHVRSIYVCEVLLEVITTTLFWSTLCQPLCQEVYVTSPKFLTYELVLLFISILQKRIDPSSKLSAIHRLMVLTSRAGAHMGDVIKTSSWFEKKSTPVHKSENML